MKGVQPPSYARALLHHVSTHDPPSPALFLPHHPPALFEARSSARPFSARTSRNIRRFTSTSAVSWATEAWPRLSRKRCLPRSFLHCSGSTAGGHAHELFAICESSGCFGLGCLGSTPQDNTVVKSLSRTSRITDDGGYTDLSRVFAVRSG